MKLKTIFLTLVLFSQCFVLNSNAGMIDWNRKLKIVEYRGSILEVNKNEKKFTLLNKTTQQENVFDLTDDLNQRLNRGDDVVILYSNLNKNIHRVEILNNK